MRPRRRALGLLRAGTCERHGTRRRQKDRRPLRGLARLRADRDGTRELSGWRCVRRRRPRRQHARTWIRRRFADCGGVLGPGVRVAKGTPVRIEAIANAVGICAGSGNDCARLRDGSMVCWGQNRGAIGNGGAAVWTPIAIPELAGASGCCLSNENGCAFFPDGHIACWGNNAEGELGLGDTVPRHSPVAVDFSGVVDLSCGSRRICARTADRRAWCWGSAQFGQVGDGTFGEPSRPGVRSRPALVDLDDVEAIAAGYDYTCAATGDDSLYCWGSNSHGELGDNWEHRAGSAVPVRAHW